MKILFVSHSADLAGAERSMYELIEGLQDVPGITCCVVVPRDGPLRARLDGLGVAVRTLPLPPWTSQSPSRRGIARDAARVLRATSRLLRLIARIHPSVVVTNTITIPAGAFAARLAGTPHVWYVHEYAVPEHGLHCLIGRRRTMRWAGRLSRRVVVPSSALKEELAELIPSEKLRVVRPAAEIRRGARPLARGASGELRLLMLGHVTPGKRQDEAIRAVSLLRRRGTEAHLTLVGWQDPRFADWLRKLATELGVADAVDFVQATDDPASFFASSHLAVTCTRHEPAPRVVIEAMKSGCPVVAARSGGTPELILDGRNGFLYEPGDVADLASKLEALAWDEDLRVRVRDYGEAWATERLSLVASTRDFMAAVHEALARPSPGSEPERHVPSIATHLPDPERMP